MNKTRQAKIDRLAELRRARLVGDKFTIAMLEANLVDFDPQPVYVPQICTSCHYEIAAMVGCRCSGEWDEE